MALLVGLWVAGVGTAMAATPLQVAYAGSMGAVMDLHLGPAFAKAHHVTYQGEGQGESPRVLWRALFVPHAAFEVGSFN
ncbi:MAG: hypothetical protein ACP5MM_08290 [Acidithiobacillus sp.]|uniref:hypothetical protein n=1 Tax=Acidithiobacillus sp. TaxID=1872118 RepID=UPI003D015157